jgi:hypothetical protein
MPSVSPWYVPSQFAPAKVAFELVEMSTGSSNLARLRAVQGAITTAVASSITAPSRRRSRSAARAVSASGINSAKTRSTASPLVSAASPTSAPSRAAGLQPGERLKRRAASSAPAMNGP